MIDTLDEKIEHLEKIGIDHLIIHPFDKKFSLLSADQFIKEYLVEKLKLKHIIIGYDHRFGKGREASVSDLKEYSICLLYTSPSPRDATTSRMPSSA